MRCGQPVQAFTAVGRVQEGVPYVFDMGGGFTPWRRGVDWQEARPAPIRPLLDTLDLTRGQASWGMAFRYGLRELSRADFDAISAAMTA